MEGRVFDAVVDVTVVRVVGVAVVIKVVKQQHVLMLCCLHAHYDTHGCAGGGA